MTVRELFNRLHFALDRGFEDSEVLITLKDPSVGARANVGIDYAGMGFDHEAGQFRLEPDEHLYKSLRMDEPAGVSKLENFYICNKCLRKVAKDDRYCRHCGQKLR